MPLSCWASWTSHAYSTVRISRSRTIYVLPLPAAAYPVFDVLAKWRKFFENQTGGVVYASLTGKALTLAMAMERVDIVSLLVGLRGLENGEVRTALSAGHICNFEA